MLQPELAELEPKVLLAFVGNGYVAAVVRGQSGAKSHGPASLRLPCLPQGACTHRRGGPHRCRVRGRPGRGRRSPWPAVRGWTGYVGTLAGSLRESIGGSRHTRSKGQGAQPSSG